MPSSFARSRVGFVVLLHVAGMAAIVLVASPARADSKVMSPAACRLANNGTTGLTYGAGHVTNTSGATVSIACPLVRDTVSSLTGLVDLEVAVTDASGTMSCSGNAVDRAGNIVKTVGLATPGTGSRIIDFAAALNVSVDRGHFQVICTVPNNAAIHSIFYQGPDPVPPPVAGAKVVAPAQCRLLGGGTSGLTYGAGHVTNTSGAAAAVVCAIVRDNTSNTNGLRDAEVAVTDATGTMTCSAVAVDRAGNLLKSVGLTIPGTGSRIIDFGSSLNLSVSRGHYQVTCNLPNNARIHSVYYDEF
jgi:hypothetical protein